MELHIKCLTQACINLNIPYQTLDTEENIVSVALAGELLFQHNRTPFNTEAAAAICKDKGHTYQLLHQQIAVPKTIAFLDFNTHEHYQKYVNYPSLPAIIHKIEQEFDYPLVIKRNGGALGVNVFLCHDKKAVEDALACIFDRASCHYDYIALAQAYIPPKQEFRAVFFHKELLLCYQRLSENKAFNVRYWDTDKGHALLIDDQAELSVLTEFAQPALELSGLNYVGLDIIKDAQGNYWLLEMNSGPKYNHFVKSNGTAEIIQLYTRILLKMREELVAKR